MDISGGVGGSLWGGFGGPQKSCAQFPTGVFWPQSALSTGGIPPGVAGLRGISCCLGTATFPFYCLTLLFAVVVSRVVVALVPARWLPASLQLRGQLRWWPVVLVVTGVCCLQLCLHAAACRCWWLSPAAAVAAPSRGLVCSQGAVVAAGLL